MSAFVCLQTSLSRAALAASAAPTQRTPTASAACSPSTTRSSYSASRWTAPRVSTANLPTISLGCVFAHDGLQRPNDFPCWAGCVAHTECSRHRLPLRRRGGAAGPLPLPALRRGGAARVRLRARPDCRGQRGLGALGAGLLLRGQPQHRLRPHRQDHGGDDRRGTARPL